MEARLRALKLNSYIHRKGKRGKPLTQQAKGSNGTKLSMRARVEHIFGEQTNDRAARWFARSAWCGQKPRSG